MNARTWLYILLLGFLPLTGLIAGRFIFDKPSHDTTTPHEQPESKDVSVEKVTGVLFTNLYRIEHRPSPEKTVVCYALVGKGSARNSLDCDL